LRRFSPIIAAKQQFSPQYLQISEKSRIFARTKQISMSAQENRERALAYIANQSNRVIDYEWEIQHHREMHEAYEKSL